MGIVPHDFHRFLLREFMIDAGKRIDQYLSEHSPDAQDFLRDALSGGGQRDLLENLEEVLSRYLAVAIYADLKRLSESKILYQAGLSGDGAESGEDDETAAKQAFSLDRINAAIRETDPGIETGNVSHLLAYKRYRHWVLGLRRPPDIRRLYVDGFFARNPAARYVINLISEHFTNNVTKACSRAFSDRAAIEFVFFKADKLKLSRIISTGSDFHKGGQQVLFLDFESAGPSGGGPSRGRRLVYKPSDVEIDYRIIGHNSDELKDLLDKNGNDIGYPTFAKSLAERINDLLDQKSPRIPTYLVLPRNPGSRSKLVGQRLPIENAYGYVEFLKHEPRPEEVFKRRPEDSRVIDQSDWVTRDPEDGLRLSRQWGQWLAIAFLSGTTDLHPENQIVHRRRPYIIDLEVSFDLLDQLSETSLAQFVRYPKEHSFNVSLNFSKGLGTSAASDNRYLPVYLDWSERTIPSKNQLYLDKIDELVPIDPMAEGHAVELTKGILEVLEVAPRSSNENNVRTWYQACESLVVRHVPEATEAFVMFIWKDLYLEMLCDGIGSDHGSVDHAFLKEALLKEKTGEILKKRISKLRAEWNKKKLLWPIFALESEGNNWRDYLNFDVPFYCRRLGEADVRNSEGRIVDTQKLTSKQNELDEAAPPINASTVQRYFKDQIPDDLVKRLDNWQKQEPGEFVFPLIAQLLTDLKVSRTVVRSVRDALAKQLAAENTTETQKTSVTA